MSADTIITVENLGKRYQLGQRSNERYTALRDVLTDKAKSLFRRNGNPRSDIRNPQSNEIWALRDVSFEVKQGEVIGIIGRNGAGKSTLLKILSRITEPTEGRVRLKGRVASLLEVGTGFHPELTGRENIFLNGAILGMTKAEIRKKFDEIVAFAEIEKFLDTPVKRYSSGMYVRLAFAVAAHLEPEILVIDEILAVGDAEFQKKCLGKMEQVSRGEGRTVLFVSHNMQAVRQLCEHVIWLGEGFVRGMGPAEEMINGYLARQTRTESLRELNEEIAKTPADPAFRMNQVDILQDGVSATEIASGKPVEVRFSYDVLQDSHGLHVYFLLCDMDGSMIFESLHNGDSPEHMPLVERGSYVSVAEIPADFLAGRSYELKIQAGIASVRTFFSRPPSISIHVHNAGVVNRAYAGYDTPGKLAPLLHWRTNRN